MSNPSDNSYTVASVKVCIDDTPLALVAPIAVKPTAPKMALKNDGPFATYFTELEEKQLFATIWRRRAEMYAERDFYWMQVLRYTGIRIAVLAGITVGEAERIVRTERFVINGEYNKRGKGGDFYCHKKVRAALTHLLRIHRKMTVGDEWFEVVRLDAPLVLSRNHRGMSIRSYQSRLKLWCLDAGLPYEASPHWFRHTFAKRQLAFWDGNPQKLLELSKHLQHSTTQTTQIYLKPDKQQMDDFARQAK